jgi:hypothetical protein
VKLLQVKTEWRVSREGERDNSGVMEREIECWKEMEMAWVGNNH